MSSPLSTLATAYQEISPVECIESLLHRAQGARVTGARLFREFSKLGFPWLLTILALPHCLPVQIPGFGVIGGCVLALLGLQMALGRKPGLPRRLLRSRISFRTVELIAKGSRGILTPLERWVRPRAEFFCSHPRSHRIHGIFICVLAVLLALPLPIPFTNLLCAWPLLIISYGILRRDGWFTAAGYVLAIPCLVAFFALVWAGQASVSALLERV